MKFNTFFYLTGTACAIAIMLIAGTGDLFAQVPPPELPGAPDQSPLSCGALLIFSALVFGIWRLRKQNDH